MKTDQQVHVSARVSARIAVKHAAETTARRVELIRRLREKINPDDPRCIFREMLLELGDAPTRRRAFLDG